MVAPYYNRPDQRMLEAHYRAIADDGALPVVVYNVPSRTGTNVEAATLLRLAEHPRIVGVKEASANLDQIATILRDRPDGFSVLAGDDAWTLTVLAHGGDGVVSVASNEIPSQMVALLRGRAVGDWDEARRIHERYLDLFRVNFISPNPVPVKAALAAMGLTTDMVRRRCCPSPTSSAPGCSPCWTQRGLPARDRGGGLMGLTSDAADPASEDARPSSATWRPVRSAPPSRTPSAPRGWRVNPDVKPRILDAVPAARACASGATRPASSRRGTGPPSAWWTCWTGRRRARPMRPAPIRVVPGGTTVRSGAHLEPGVTSCHRRS